jgi:hypothetical protein
VARHQAHDTCTYSPRAVVPERGKELRGAPFSSPHRLQLRVRKDVLEAVAHGPRRRIPWATSIALCRRACAGERMDVM